MKADFKKWLFEKYGRISRQAKVFCSLWQDDINQFATDFAKQENTELIKERDKYKQLCNRLHKELKMP